MRRETNSKLSENAASGVVALIFLILGFELAVFVMKVVRKPAVELVQETVPPSDTLPPESDVPLPDHGTPGDGYVRSFPGSSRSAGAEQGRQYRKSSLGGYEKVEDSHLRRLPRKVESFPFDPNTIPLSDLQRLGFSLRQAQSIENYRAKGGRFRRKSDFAKMYVVSDSLYARLEPYITIPPIDLNSADSAALVSLPGIGPYYAALILEYRERLGGYVCTDQLLEIERFDQDRYLPIKDCISADSSEIRKINLWEDDEKRLADHPYIGERAASAVTRFKKVYDTAQWTVENLAAEHILTSEVLSKLKFYLTLQVNNN